MNGMMAGWRTWAETFSGCVLKFLLYTHILPFIPKAKDPIMYNGRLAHVLQAICNTPNKYSELGVKSSSQAHLRTLRVRISKSCRCFRRLGRDGSITVSLTGVYKEVTYSRDIQDT